MTSYSDIKKEEGPQIGLEGIQRQVSERSGGLKRYWAILRRAWKGFSLKFRGPLEQMDLGIFLKVG